MFTSKPSSNKKRANLMCAFVAAYIAVTSYFLYQVHEFTNDIYNYPYYVSSQAREMRFRFYNFRVILPVLLSSANYTIDDIRHTFTEQQAMYEELAKTMEQRFRGDPKEFAEFKQALKAVGDKRNELAEITRLDTTYENVLKQYERISSKSFDDLDDILVRMARNADERGNEINQHANSIIDYIVLLSIFMGLALILFIYRQTELINGFYSKLTDREKLFNILSTNVDDVYFIFGRDCSLEYVSPNAKRLLNEDSDSIQQDPELLFRIFKPEDLDWIKSKLLDENLSKVENRSIKVESLDREYKLSVYPAKEKSAEMRFILSMFDETEQARYRSVLTEALANAENASTAKGQFLSNMSHEIRTPLNAIIGMATIALAEINNKARIRDCLDKTLQSSKHLLGLINDILDMSKIESHKFTLVDEPFNLKESLRNISNLIGLQAVEKNLEFEIDTKNVACEDLVGDSLRLNQILINLLGNAVKFTPEGGRVSLTMSQKLMGNKLVHLKFVVADTGIGMREDEVEKMFLPFEQGKQMTRSKYKGTGLGLPITKNLVDLMGGTMLVKSKVGEGTTFTLDIPFKMSEPKTETASELQEFHALVVDDEALTCEHACLLLSQLGQRTDFVLSGKDALVKIEEAIAAGDPYDICFLDWRMPEMDGIETARRIRKIVGSDTLIIIISAYDWSIMANKVDESIGINGFIAKPFFTSSFYDCLSINKSRPQAKQQEETADKDGKPSGRILVVEDNEFNKEIAEEYLVMSGFQVDCVEDGLQAVKAFNDNPSGYYSMILMDIQMPVMGGLEATKTIRALQRPDAKTIPIVAMTANAFTEDVSASLAVGMNDHISKPIDMKVLQKVLLTHIVKKST